jgi:glutaredoxin
VAPARDDGERARLLEQALSDFSKFSKIVLYARPNCPLCDESRLVLLTAQIEFEEVDVTTDPALEREFGSMVPIVMVGGRPIFHGGGNPADLPGLIAGQANGRRKLR